MPATAARRRRRVRLRRIALSNRPADGVGDTRRIAGAVVDEAQREGTGPVPAGRARASKLARSRMRQIRRRDAPATYPADTQHCAASAVRIRVRKPWVLAALASVGLEGALHGRPPRGGRRTRAERGHAGGGNDPVYGAARTPRATREPRGRRRPGKTAVNSTPCRQGRRWYVARLARPRPGVLRTSPAGSGARPGRT